MTRLRTLLLLSVLGNLFSFGLIAGGLAVFWHYGTIPLHAGSSGSVPTRPLFEAGATLPEPDRTRFAAAMGEALAANRFLRREARRERRDAALLFDAPTFDRPAVAAALGRARTDDFTLRQRLEDAALDFAATLPADERAELAAGLSRGGPLRHPHR